MKWYKLIYAWFLARKYINMVITCKNHKNEFVNLLEGLGSLDDGKPTNPWVFISKLKQGLL